MRLVRALPLAVVAVFSVHCYDPPDPLPLHQIVISPDLQAELESLRAEFGVHGIDVVLHAALDTWFFNHVAQNPRVRGSDCVDAPDSGEWRYYLCPDAKCGSRDDYACDSDFRPPCDPGLVFAGTNPEYPRIGFCRAAPDAAPD